ncbi:class I SAM-dependent methyltransferase [Candidatus Gottesmanbacteria bacterium]|nr:class I SAM-dependent methyltransferase [Candidatus Gottesmanbacteria bacterium]
MSQPINTLTKETILVYFLKAYLRKRPLFLSLIRAKEAQLFQKYLPFKHPVLDIGCGDGMFAKVTFSKCHPELVSGSQSDKKEMLKRVQHDRLYGSEIDIGLDLAGSRINEARQSGIYKKIIIYDGKEIPFQDNYFSTIISNSTLEHVSDLDTVLKEIYRVLKPGGLFITTVMAKPWEENLFGAKILGDLYKKWMGKKQIHRNLLTKNEWDEAFRKSGFIIKKAIGYLTPQACQLIDVCHYLSIPSLVTYKLFGKWVVFPSLFTRLYPTKSLAQVISENVDPDQSGAIFYLLEK